MSRHHFYYASVSQKMLFIYSLHPNWQSLSNFLKKNWSWKNRILLYKAKAYPKRFADGLVLLQPKNIFFFKLAIVSQ